MVFDTMLVCFFVYPDLEVEIFFEVKSNRIDFKIIGDETTTARFYRCCPSKFFRKVPHLLKACSFNIYSIPKQCVKVPSLQCYSC